MHPIGQTGNVIHDFTNQDPESDHATHMLSSKVEDADEEGKSGMA